jgi:uncharacterized membrane protein
LIKRWEGLRSSFWFLPALMAASAAALAFATVAIDQAKAGRWLASVDWLYTGGADGASLLLGTVAGSMITIAGTVFSMTLVALSLASSQLGPRLLRVFMRDTANQVVLGTFVSTFVYCLMVLRTIRRADGMEFVPHLSVTTGVLLAVVSLAVLIYFIHHVSVSIQADHVVARVGKELIDGIDRLFPEKAADRFRAPPTAAPRTEDGAAIGAPGDGYLQMVDEELLLAIAARHDLLLLLERRPGQYLVRGQALLRVVPAERATHEVAAELRTAFVLRNERSPAQDIEFLVIQLVEIAVRALSPSVNDPFTAIACVDRLASGLCRLATREPASAQHFDVPGRMRMVVPGLTLSGAVDAAFDPIRQYGSASADVLGRLLDAIAVIAPFTQRAEDLHTLRRHAQKIVRAAHSGLPEANDRLVIQARFAATLSAIDLDAGGLSAAAGPR